MIDEILTLKEKHKDTWQDKPTYYWYLMLVEEVLELGLSLLSLHRHTPTSELMQIITICMNWIEKK